MRILSQANGGVRLDTDIRGKRGILNKSAQVFTSAGVQTLHFKIAIGVGQTSMNRKRNQVMAKADPQAVFRVDCARCHAKPSENQLGRELFVTACGICHEAKHRASMVPDLRTHPLSADVSAWAQLITNGKPETLMPAFAKRHGGPLTEAQIRSLAEFMIDRFPASMPKRR